MSSRPFPITPPGLWFVSWGLLEGTPPCPGAASSPGLQCRGRLWWAAHEDMAKHPRRGGFSGGGTRVHAPPPAPPCARVSSNPQTASCQAEHVTSSLELLKGLQERPNAPTCRHVAFREGWGWCEAWSEAAEAIVPCLAGPTGTAVSWGWLQVPGPVSGGFSLHCHSPISVPTTVPCQDGLPWGPLPNRPGSSSGSQLPP